MFNLNKYLRKNIKNLKPYSSARNEYKGKEAIFLDANENPFNAPYNRYPDPLHIELKSEIAKIKGVLPAQIFLGNGSDEAIDLAFRAFCNPGIDNMVTIDPTYDMYKVCADINDVQVKKVKLLKGFKLPVKQILNKCDEKTKLVFICSPNNPTSNCFDKKDIIEIIENTKGIVVLDEAYIDFAPGKSLLPQLSKYQNLIILQTFSKAWGMAGVRLGMAFASEQIINVFNGVKYPYNINSLTARFAIEMVREVEQKNKWVKQLLDNRANLLDSLSELNMVREILPSDANFVMVRFDDSQKVFEYLVNKKIIIRDRSKAALCEGFLRVTVGTQSENLMLISALRDFQNMSDV